MSLRGKTIQVDVDLVTETCCNCGVLFAMPSDLQARLLQEAEKGSFYCPNGHSQHYLGKSLKAQLEEARRKTASALEDARIAAAAQAARIAHLDSGGVMWSPITSTFVDERLRITVSIEVRDGQPSCRGYSVEPVGPVGLEQQTTEVARGLNLRKLMSHAVMRAALQAEAEGYAPATSIEAIAPVVGSTVRRRAAITDDELRAFVAAYEANYQPNHMAEFADNLDPPKSEATAWRWLRLARQRGLMPERGER